MDDAGHVGCGRTRAQPPSAAHRLDGSRQCGAPWGLLCRLTALLSRARERIGWTVLFGTMATRLSHETRTRRRVMNPAAED